MKLPSNAIIINSFWNKIMFRHSDILLSWFPWTIIDKKNRYVKWLKTVFSSIIFVLSIREPTVLGFEFTEYFFYKKKKNTMSTNKIGQINNRVIGIIQQINRLKKKYQFWIDSHKFMIICFFPSWYFGCQIIIIFIVFHWPNRGFYQRVTAPLKTMFSCKLIDSIWNGFSIR